MANHLQATTKCTDFLDFAWHGTTESESTNVGPRYEGMQDYAERLIQYLGSYFIKSLKAAVFMPLAFYS